MSDKPEPGNDPGASDAGPQGTMFIRAADLHGPEPPAKLSAGHASSAALIGISEAFKGRRFRLDKDRMTVGSKTDAGNDIVIPESTVSFMHARLIHEQGQWRILNILSTNGTFINGEKIIEAPVRHGDRVRFGGVEFVFQDAADLSEPGGDPGDREAATALTREGRLWWWSLALAAAVLAVLVLFLL